MFILNIYIYAYYLYNDFFIFFFFFDFFSGDVATVIIYYICFTRIPHRLLSNDTKTFPIDIILYYFVVYLYTK